MKCLLHIGLHHTGTTSLQTILSNNNVSLQRFGIVYPTSIKHGMQHSLLPGIYLSDHYALPKIRNLDLDHYLKKLRNELNKKKATLCIISSEVFNELISKDRKSLLEILKNLDEIFEDISIMITTRDFKERAFSMQKAQIRASDFNKNFRREIFDAPERFRNKVKGGNADIKNWENCGKKLIILKMQEDISPVNFYLETIFSNLNLDKDTQKKFFTKFKKIISKQNLKLNYDSIHPVVYGLLILVGKKINNANSELKDKLTLNKVNKFIDNIDIKIRNKLFLFNKNNLISFLENYDLKEYNEKKIQRVLLSTGLDFSALFMIIKVIDEFIYELILSE